MAADANLLEETLETARGKFPMTAKISPLPCCYAAESGLKRWIRAGTTAAAGPSTRYLADPIMPKATILVVDDEALIRWSLAERLKADGYDVLEADTGRAALDKLPEGVDLILLDYRLPDTDGVTVLRKAKEFDQDILVILLTAYASVETAVEAMKLGAYHFANKPFNLDEVAATVDRALETTRLRREVRQFKTNAARPVQPAACRRRLSGDYRSPASCRPGRGQSGFDGAAHRRERHRQGSCRQGHSLCQRPVVEAVHEHHVLGASGAITRKRALRSRARRVHRRAHAEEGIARNR